MTHLIDKDALVAEIERRLKANGAFDEVGDSAWWEDKGMCDAYKSILSFLNTLEVKEVDLEKEIDEWCNKCISDYELEGWVGMAIQNVAKHFFELGLKAGQG